MQIPPSKKLRTLQLLLLYSKTVCVSLRFIANNFVNYNITESWLQHPYQKLRDMSICVHTVIKMTKIKFSESMPSKSPMKELCNSSQFESEYTSWLVKIKVSFWVLYVKTVNKMVTNFFSVSNYLCLGYVPLWLLIYCS